MTGATPKKQAQAGRSAARLAAVQGLYQMDIAATGIAEVIRDLTATPLRDAAGDEAAADAPADEAAEPDATYLAELLRGVVRLQREIDPLVDNQLAAGWRLARAACTARSFPVRVRARSCSFTSPVKTRWELCRRFRRPAPPRVRCTKSMMA